jgi:hypothetical protein
MARLQWRRLEWWRTTLILPMKQVSDGNGFVDHATLENVAAVC